MNAMKDKQKKFRHMYNISVENQSKKKHLLKKLMRGSHLKDQQLKGQLLHNTDNESW